MFLLRNSLGASKSERSGSEIVSVSLSWVHLLGLIRDKWNRSENRHLHLELIQLPEGCKH
jgi:hypothetical protein